MNKFQLNILNMMIDQMRLGNKVILIKTRKMGWSSFKKEFNKITVEPSPRIDWCGVCKIEHGYFCPKQDTP